MVEGWRRQTFGEIVRIASGQVDPRDDAVGRKLSVGPDCLRIGGGIEKDKLQTANDLKQVSGKYAFDRDAILYAKIRPNLNKVGLPDFDGICSADVYPIWIKDSNATDRTFVYFLLTSDRFVADASARSFRTGIPKINRPDLESIIVALPPLPEQRKIAEILRTWDEAIEATTKLVKALNARREALRTKLITEADLGGRPTVFGEFLKESRVLGSDGASARKITVKLYGKGAVPKSDKREGSAKTRYYRRSPGQLIYSKLDFLNGAFALIPEALQGYESSLDLPAFDISEPVNPKWLIEYLTRPAYYTAQLHLARGQRKARRIAPDDFLASPVRFPQRDRQDEIAEVLAVVDREIALRETELDTLTRQKRGLMQKLLTGEWRVKL